MASSTLIFRMQWYPLEDSNLTVRTPHSDLPGNRSTLARRSTFELTLVPVLPVTSCAFAVAATRISTATSTIHTASGGNNLDDMGLLIDFSNTTGRALTATPIPCRALGVRGDR